MHLYEFHPAIAAILATADPETGELPPEAEQQLAALELSQQDKLDAIGRVLQQIELAADQARTEANRLRDLAGQRQRTADRLRNYVLHCLQDAGCQRIDTPLFRFTVCRNSQPSIRLLDGAAIPPGYERVQVTLDTAKVRETLAAGYGIPDGVIIEQGCHLRIR